MTQATSELRFSILGPLRVERDGVAVDVGGPKQRLLLGVLLLSANKTVSVDRLIDLLWGDGSNERAQSTLHVYVAKLRKTLAPLGDGASPVETVRPGYRLNVAHEQVDLLVFHAAVAKARRSMAAGRLDAAAEEFKAALTLPRGSLLADLADEDFVFQETQAYESALLTAMSDYYDCEIQRGRHVEVLGDLQKVASENPLDERLCSLHMIALYRSGRQVEALSTYASLRTTLAEELGIEPGPEIQELEMKVLNHDPVLATRGFRSHLDEAPPTVTRSTRVHTTAFLLLDGLRIQLNRVVTTIGRLPDRAVVLHDPDASRQHAEIRRTAEGYLLVDMGSTNGTSVNGRRVSTHLLESGDDIEVGDTILTFRDVE